MKGAEPTFLIGIECPLYNYSGSVHLHLGVDSQHGVDPDSHCQAGHGHLSAENHGKRTKKRFNFANFSPRPP